MARAAVPRESVVLRKRPTAAYRIIWKAIRAHKRIIFSYGDRPREACPHILGYKASGNEAVFVFQVGGESSKPLSPEGDWRCFDLAWRIFSFATAPGEAVPGTARRRPASSLSISTPMCRKR